jgi:hypothetical protein
MPQPLAGFFASSSKLHGANRPPVPPKRSILEKASASTVWGRYKDALGLRFYKPHLRLPDEPRKLARLGRLKIGAESTRKQGDREKKRR